MAYASTFPAAVAGLTAALRRNAGLAGVLVGDMVSLTDTNAEEAVIAAYAGTDDDTAAEGSLAQEGYGGAQDREAYDIHCVIAVRAGGGNLAAARARAFVLLAACGQALAEDRELGGAVMTAVITSWSLLLDFSLDEGALARIRFNVSIDAFTNR